MPVEQLVQTDRGIYQWGTDSISNPIVYCFHGAGECAASWWLMCDYISRISDYLLISIDLRAHGGTRVNGDEDDLRIDTMSLDFSSVHSSLFQEKRDCFLVGHSMGGALVVDIANKNQLNQVLGVIVIDIVEETALDSLKFMKSILLQRPTTFKTDDEAINWLTESKKLKTIETAEHSVRSLFINDETGLKWRTDLFKSEPFWQDWFTDLSSKFLACKCSKLLVLAGTERLDKPLLIAQMQGKFQLKIVRDTNHYIHENDPVVLGDEIFAFVQKNKSFVVKRFDARGNPIN